MELLDKYYLILGVNQNVTIDELKQAYREKAKIYHPDRNPSPNAHEQFIVLTEAYECLVNLKSEKLNHNNKRTKYYSNATDEQKVAREKARAQAQHYAKMRYQEFIKTEYYKNISSLNTIFDHFIYVFAISLVFLLPLLGYLFADTYGVVIASIIVLATAPITIRFIKQMNFNFPSLGKSIFQILQTRYFAIVLISIINILTFINIGFQTMIPLFSLISIYILTTTAYLGFDIIFSTFSTHKKRRNFIALCLIPLIINILLFVNFKFSKDPNTETCKILNYDFDKSTFIVLENNKYAQYPGIRLFSRYDDMASATHVKYTFEDGALGIRVMKHYEFK